MNTKLGTDYETDLTSFAQSVCVYFEVLSFFRGLENALTRCLGNAEKKKKKKRDNEGIPRIPKLLFPPPVSILPSRDEMSRNAATPNFSFFPFWRGKRETQCLQKSRTTVTPISAPLEKFADKNETCPFPI